MRDRVRRPVRVVVLALLFSAQAAWCAESGTPPPTPDLAEILQQAQKMRQAVTEAQEAQVKAMEAAGMTVSKPAALAPQRKSPLARGAKKASADTKEKPQGFSDIRVTLEGSFDLHVQDADIRTVLRQLSAQAKKNIVTSNQVSGTVTADLYSVEFAEALYAVTEAAGLVCRTKEDVVYVFTPAEMATRKEEMPIEARVFRLSYLRAATARDLINGMLSPKGKAMITPEEHTNIEPLPTPTWDQQRLRNVAEDVLVVHDYEYILDKVARVIRKVDVKPEQVLVEATILSATLNDDNALGVDLQGLIGTNFNSFGMNSDLTDMNVGLLGGVNDFSHWQSRVASNFTQNMPVNFGPAFSFGIVHDNVGAFVQALESVRDVTVLANPKLLVVNKQRGEVLVGRKDGYLTTVVTDTSAIQQVAFLETGTSLIVRPFVGANDNIRLEINPKDSSGTVEPAEGTTADSPALPRETTTQVTTNIMVRDGKTVVIAGLFRDQVQTTRRQLPILGDIPWAGTLFRSTVDSTTRSEVIILITPHIVRDILQEAIGERMGSVVERYRIGAREGLRWWGRNRLSEDYLKRANQSWSDGDVEKARWWLDLCLSLQPDLVEGMLLKERMTDEASWAQPPQYTDTRFLITRMLMQEIGRDVDTVIPPQRPLHDGDLRPEVRKALGVQLKPRASGVIHRQERYAPVWRKDSSVPGDMEMKPVPAVEEPAKAPAPPAPPAEKVRTIDVSPEPRQVPPAAPVRKPVPASALPKPVPAAPPVPKATPIRETKPAEKPKPAIEAEPAIEAKPAVEAEPAPAPEAKPAAAPEKDSDGSAKPRLAPIKDQPVSPASESSLSTVEVPAESVPPLSKTAASDTLTPEPAVRQNEIETDLPEAGDEPGLKKPIKTEIKTKTAPGGSNAEPRSLEQDGKSPTRRYLETGTLSVLLKEAGQ